jgi:hypothetical protein
MRSVRRKEREIKREEALGILKKGEYGILSTSGEENQPYGVPVNYCFIADCIYFHSAPVGHKIANFRYNPKVSFCVVGNTSIIPAEFSSKYESVIVFGRLYEVFGEEKQKALEELLRKYSADFFAAGLKEIASHQDKTRVFKISVNEVSGKARR